jgi:hypothetical protein
MANSFGSGIIELISNRVLLSALLAKSGLAREEKEGQLGSHTKIEVLGGIAWGFTCAAIVSLM